MFNFWQRFTVELMINGPSDWPCFGKCKQTHSNRHEKRDCNWRPEPINISTLLRFCSFVLFLLVFFFHFIWKVSGRWTIEVHTIGYLLAIVCYSSYLYTVAICFPFSFSLFFLHLFVFIAVANNEKFMYINSPKRYKSNENVWNLINFWKTTWNTYILSPDICVGSRQLPSKTKIN